MSESAFSEHDEDDTIEGYRPLSPIAIVSLLLGLASGLAMLNPVLWLVPLGAIALGVLAYLKIQRQHTEISGATLAMMAIIIGAFMFGLASVRHFYWQQKLNDKGAQFVSGWVELLKDGHLHQAHQYTLKKENRLKPDQDVATFYLPAEEDLASTANREPLDSDSLYQKMRTFFDCPELDRVIQWKDEADWQCSDIESRGYDRLRKNRVIEYTYHVTGPNNEWVDFKIVVFRFDAGNVWVVSNFELINASSRNTGDESLGHTHPH